MDQKEIENVVKAVLASMSAGTQPAAASAAPQQAAASQNNGFGVFESLDDAVLAAKEAQKSLKTVEMRNLCIGA
ncbi:hypothetical protein K6U71_15895, partial [Vibrio alginolyticus]|nr:hypothetical protein [Vibrio alginolyticus]